MKIKGLLSLALLAATALTSCGTTPNYNATIKSSTDTAAYYLGLIQGSEMKQSAPGFSEMNIDAYARGISEAYNKSELPVAEEDLITFLNNYMMEAQNQIVEANLTAGQDFLKANGAREGVITTASGLQYEILTAGTGAIPDSVATVKLHYHGTTTDGTVFDSSVERGEPVEFGLGAGLISGFNEALTLMPVGSKWKIYLPADLAYGANPPQGSGIQANAVLIFEVELLDIVKPDAE